MAFPQAISDIILYSPQLSNRLSYIAELAGQLLTGRPMTCTSDADQYRNSTGIRINYSNAAIADCEIRIQPAGLINDTGISEQRIAIVQQNPFPVFFANEAEIGFDIFSASFFLVTRYEEYLPHEKDQYGRYAHEQSTAWRNNFLNRPLINEWFSLLAELIKQKFDGYRGRPGDFLLLPTYDIDIAWANKQQPPLHRIKNKLKELLNSFDSVEQNAEAPTRDPYDSFEWLHGLHQEFQLKPYYFFLLAEKRSEYDKNIDPSVREFRELVYQHFLNYPVGIHPSWQSGDEHELLLNEKQLLENITGGTIKSSRQHYLRFALPETYRRLLECGIRYDFSMGYGAVQGFRASICTAFNWYDLQREEATELFIVPFCFMDTTSIYQLRHSPQEALKILKDLYGSVKAVGGTFCMIWHNHMLGNLKEFAEWRNLYQQFFRETASGADTPD